jgi:hypothetical protein
MKKIALVLVSLALAATPALACPSEDKAAAQRTAEKDKAKTKAPAEKGTKDADGAKTAKPAEKPAEKPDKVSSR